MRRALALAFAMLPIGCGGCEDVGCAHPLALDVRFPEPSPDEPVSLVVEYDGERRFASCPSLEAGCEVTCGNATCPDGDRDVLVTRSAGALEVSIGHMSERRSDGESSCLGATEVALDVSRGRATFETVTLEIEYQRHDEYGGPGCGDVDSAESRVVTLTLP